MTDNTKKQFGIILTAIASIGAELLGTEPAAEAPATSEAPTPKKRGRPAAATQHTSSESEPTPTAIPATSTPAPEPEPAAEVEGMTFEQLREICDHLIKEGMQEEIKGLIRKHGGTKLRDIPPAAHSAFAKDVEALAY